MLRAVEFTELVDLAAERFGGAVLWANDEWFAEKENLLKPSAPEFIDGKYTDRGKWMDGWETRRRRTPGHDTCIVRLGLPGVVRGLVVDTAFFKGNYPLECSVEAATFAGHPTPEELLDERAQWSEILPRSPLKGDAKNAFSVGGAPRCTHLRFHIYPDGGVARLRVHGEAVADLRWMGKRGAEVDLASLEHGATVPRASDMFFGSRNNLVLPGRGLNMGDGWETRRSGRVSTETDRTRVHGADWALVALAGEGIIERAEVDTTHFKGNAPESASLEVAASADGPWTPILARSKLQPHNRHFFDALGPHEPARFARILIWPDGGVMRLRLWGALTERGRERCGLAFLNALASEDAEAALVACCGSSAWAKKVTAARPFASLDALKKTSAETWAALGGADHDQAFAAHPRIGETKRAAAATAQSHAWSTQEQRGVTEATKETLAELVSANAEYEKKFGMIYIVCATGKTPDQMLALAKQRLGNDPATERKNAAEEQRKITDLRLEKMVLR
jgi:allantoicase